MGFARRAQSAGNVRGRNFAGCGGAGGDSSSQPWRMLHRKLGKDRRVGGATPVRCVRGAARRGLASAKRAADTRGMSEGQTRNIRVAVQPAFLDDQSDPGEQRY